MDSERLATTAAIDVLAAAAEKLGVPPVTNKETLVERYAGVPFRKIIHAFEQRFDIRLNHMEVALLKDMAVFKALEQVKECPGVSSALAQMSDRYQLAVVTNCEGSRLDLTLQAAGLTSFFPEQHKYSAHESLEVPCFKPEPDIYLYALEAEGVAAGAAGAVENKVTGVESASRAGIRTIIGYVGASLVPQDDRDREARDLLQAGCTIVISNMKDLSPIALAIDHDVDPATLKFQGQSWLPPTRAFAPTETVGSHFGAAPH